MRARACEGGRKTDRHRKMRGEEGRRAAGLVIEIRQYHLRASARLVGGWGGGTASSESPESGPE